jgi:acetylornithine deacetylase/succinyl-diaminopimelate desuccinylase-like protein
MMRAFITGKKQTVIVTDVHALIDARRDAILQDYLALLRIPSVSAQHAHDADTRRAAKYVVGMLRAAGLENARLIKTATMPLVVAEWLHAPGKPTVLIYAHYDVQPADRAVDGWDTDPFDPVIDGEYIFGRGVTDDKNQLTGTIHAVGALLAATGSLPVNVRFLIEGEEESSGEAIEKYVREHATEIPCDIAMVADGGIAALDQPQLHYGCRGILYTEIVAKGADHDLHSGGYGGNAPNPLFALAEILTQLKAPDGRITIPGLYEMIREPTEAERATWKKQERLLDAEIRRDVGAPLVGEAAFTPLERAWARPTLEVHGFIGGFQDEGQKTVIPSTARVKVSLRLVPDQTPQAVLPLLQRRVAEVTPVGIATEVRMLGGGLPLFTDPTSPAFQAAAQALREEFSRDVWLSRSGGSVPIAVTFKDVLGADPIMIGFGLPGDRAHGPNERTHLPTFFRGVHTLARVLIAFGEMKEDAQ